MIPYRTLCSSKNDLAGKLREWLATTDASHIGGSPTGVTAWVFVNVAGRELRLNSDTKRDGVRRFLALSDEHGVDMEWHIVPNQRNGRLNKLAFGPDRKTIPGFYFYTIEDAEEPAVL